MKHSVVYFHGNGITEEAIFLSEYNRTRRQRDIYFLIKNEETVFWGRTIDQAGKVANKYQQLTAFSTGS